MNPSASEQPSAARPSGPELPTSPEEWEQIRRSVAMLSPGAWALRREPALHALGLLIGHLRSEREEPGAGR